MIFAALYDGLGHSPRTAAFHADPRVLDPRRVNTASQLDVAPGSQETI